MRSIEGEDHYGGDRQLMRERGWRSATYVCVCVRERERERERKRERSEKN